MKQKIVFIIFFFCMIVSISVHAEYILQDSFENDTTLCGEEPYWTEVDSGNMFIETGIIHSGLQSCRLIAGDYIHTTENISLTTGNQTCAVWTYITSGATNGNYASTMMIRNDQDRAIGYIYTLSSTNYSLWDTYPNFIETTESLQYGSWVRSAISVQDTVTKYYVNNTNVFNASGQVDMEQIWIGQSSGGKNGNYYFDDVQCWNGDYTDEPTNITPILSETCQNDGNGNYTVGYNPYPIASPVLNKNYTLGITLSSLGCNLSTVELTIPINSSTIQSYHYCTITNGTVTTDGSTSNVSFNMNGEPTFFSCTFDNQDDGVYSVDKSSSYNNIFSDFTWTISTRLLNATMNYLSIPYMNATNFTTHNSTTSYDIGANTLTGFQQNNLSFTFSQVTNETVICTSTVNSIVQQSVNCTIPLLNGGECTDAYTIHNFNTSNILNTIVLNCSNRIFSWNMFFNQTCTESWIENVSVCNGNNYTITYTDSNMCGTATTLPLLNGSIVSCGAVVSGLTLYNQSINNDLPLFIQITTTLLLVAIAIFMLFSIITSTSNNMSAQLLEKYFIVFLVITGIILMILIIKMLIVPLHYIL